MAKYRQIHVDIWDDDKFEDYSPHAKLLFIYGFSNKHRNEAGMYSISIKKMAFETGMTIEETEKALNEIIESGSWQYDHDAKVLWVKNALRYQTVNDKCLIAIKRDIANLNTPLIEEFYNHCNELGYPLDTHSIPANNPQETQAGKDKGNDKDKGKGNDKNIYSPEFEKWYSEFPRPQAKADSFKNFEKVRKAKGLEVILTATRNYIYHLDSQQDKQRAYEYAYSSNNFLGQKAYYQDFVTGKEDSHYAPYTGEPDADNHYPEWHNE